MGNMHSAWTASRQNILKVLYFLIYIAKYYQTANVSRTLVGNQIVDHSVVDGASPVGTAASSFAT